MHKTPETRRLLTARQVAEELMLSPSAVYRAVERGELKAVRLGGRGTSIRIPISEVERVLAPITK